MKRVVLGVSGSVAAYRAADLARELMRGGCEVRVCLTDAARNFVSPALFEALTGNPCLEDTFDEPERGRMAHIDWARQADLLLIAPATADTLNKLAAGFADDMLSTLALAYRGAIVVAPAMNPSMFAHEATRSALRTLRERGAFVIEPLEGDVACGENGQGKLASVVEIAAQVQAVLSATSLLEGRRVLITSGPTQEAIDDVRFLSNRSSGKMGAALARAALLMGAEVTVVTGPTSVALPLDAKVHSVRTAIEMRDAAVSLLTGHDWVIGAAAVADYRPAEPATGKLRRTSEELTLKLVPNPDIIATLARAAGPNQRVVGFAAEPDGGLEVAREKILKKKLFAIAVNDVSRSDIAFERDENELTVVFSDGRLEKIEKAGKLQVAMRLWEHLIARGAVD